MSNSSADLLSLFVSSLPATFTLRSFHHRTSSTAQHPFPLPPALPHLLPHPSQQPQALARGIYSRKYLARFPSTSLPTTLSYCARAFQSFPRRSDTHARTRGLAPFLYLLSITGLDTTAHYFIFHCGTGHIVQMWNTHRRNSQRWLPISCLPPRSLLDLAN